MTFEARVWGFVNIHRHAKCEIAFWAESKRDQVPWWKPIYQKQLVCCSTDVGPSVSIFLVLKDNFSAKDLPESLFPVYHTLYLLEVYKEKGKKMWSLIEVHYTVLNTYFFVLRLHCVLTMPCLSCSMTTSSIIRNCLSLKQSFEFYWLNLCEKIFANPPVVGVSNGEQIWNL